MTSSTGRSETTGHSDSVPEHSTQTKDTVAWIVVSVILLGVITAAVGLMAVRLPVIIVGAAVVAVGLILAVVLPKTGLSRPVSFAENVPSQTAGPRARGDGGDGRDGRDENSEPYETVPEAPASELPQTPDSERAKPQYVNLAPHERIRRIGGEDVIEVPDERPGSD